MLNTRMRVRQGTYHSALKNFLQLDFQLIATLVHINFETQKIDIKQDTHHQA
jgi:hypothetical protein